MLKGYWIAHVTVRDSERYKEYQALNAIAFAKYNARFLVRGGGEGAQVRGGALKQRHVVIEFESLAVARACYDSPEYKAAIKVRDLAGEVDIVVAEGYAG